MTDFFSKWFASEVIKHPAVLMFGLIFVGGVAGVTFNPFVLAVDFAGHEEEIEGRFGDVEQAICGVRKDIRVESLDQQLRAVESDIWKLERIINAGEGSDFDEHQLDKMRSDLGKLKRKLEQAGRESRCSIVTGGQN